MSHTLDDLCDHLEGQLHDAQEESRTTRAENERLTAVNADLLAALERSLQYVVLGIHDARRDPRISASTIKTGEADYKMITAAIAKAKGEMT